MSTKQSSQINKTSRMEDPEPFNKSHKLNVQGRYHFAKFSYDSNADWSLRFHQKALMNNGIPN